MGRKGSAMLRSNFDEKPLPRGRNDRIVGVDCLDRISSPAHWEPSGFANWEWLGSPEKGHHKIHTGSLIAKVQWGGHPGSGSVPRFCTMLRQRDPPMGSHSLTNDFGDISETKFRLRPLIPYTKCSFRIRNFDAIFAKKKTKVGMTPQWGLRTHGKRLP